MRGRMLREHRGFSSGLVLEPPSRALVRTLRFVLPLRPVRLRACCEQAWVYEEGVPALPVCERAGGSFTGLLRRGKVGRFRLVSLRLTYATAGAAESLAGHLVMRWGYGRVRAYKAAIVRGASEPEPGRPLPSTAVSQWGTTRPGLR